MMKNKKVKYLVEIEFIRTIFEGIVIPILIVLVIENLLLNESVYTLGVTITCIAQVIFSFGYVFLIKKFDSNILIKGATTALLISVMILFLHKIKFCILYQCSF